MFHRSIQPLTGRVPLRAPHHPERALLGIANLDRALIVRQANQDFVTQFHRSATAIYGHSIYDLIHPSEHGLIQQDFGRLIEGKAHRFVRRTIALAQRDRADAGELTATVVRDETSRVAGVTVLFRLEPDTKAGPTQPVDQPSISKIDARILEGIAAGASTLQLAAQLHLSRQGVEYHVSTMLRKLDAANRTALVSKAHSMGLLRLDVWPPVAVVETIH